ncbi:MAG: GH36 C-terminal domain-containing protein [Clostridia bacterium]|nr:GH36 C-terminal domain-containing protein [Clostridia bacterium]
MKSLFGRAVSFLLLPALIFLTFFRNFSGGVFLDCTPKYCKNGVSETADGYTDAEVLANGGALVKGSSASLVSGDMRLSLDIQNDRLYVTRLSTLKNGENRIAGASVFSLPAYILSGGAPLRLRWKYDSVRQYAAVRNGAAETGVCYRFRSVCGGFALEVACAARPALAGPFEFCTALENLSGQAQRIVPEAFAAFTFGDVYDGDELMMIKKESGMSEGYTHYDGQSFEGEGIIRSPLKFGRRFCAWVNTLQNFNAGGYLPMVWLDGGDHGCYTALEWSSGRINVTCSNAGAAVSADLDCVGEKKYVFSTAVPAGETFSFPSVYLGAYDGTVDAGSNVFKRWFFACKAPAKLRDDPNEPLTQMDFQSGLETYGIEAVKWDYGWWTNETLGNWKTLEGSWQLRNDGYRSVLAGYGCETLSQFGALTKAQGKSLTTYVLLHDTLDADGDPTDAYGEFNSKTHPEWFSDRRIDLGMGNSADLGNTECVAYLQGALADFFNSNNVTTWRSDFEPICYSSDKQNRHDANGTDVQYWCTVGFKEIVDSLYADVPGFRYESCSSGGSMKDLFTATLAVVINCDDAANYAGMRATFYDSSYVIHPAQLQMPCNADFADPTQALFHPKAEQGGMTDGDFRAAMLDTEFRTQCLGVPMFSSWTGTLLTDYYAKYAEMYKTKLRPLIREGALYHILPRPDGVNWDGVQYADADAAGGIKGAAFLFKPSAAAGETLTVALQGLDPDTVYSLEFEDRPEQNVSLSGRDLMDGGLTVRIADAVGSEIVWIKG